jgi:hypothetical protein
MAGAGRLAGSTAIVTSASAGIGRQCERSRARVRRWRSQAGTAETQRRGRIGDRRIARDTGGRDARDGRRRNGWGGAKALGRSMFS